MITAVEENPLTVVVGYQPPVVVTRLLRVVAIIDDEAPATERVICLVVGARASTTPWLAERIAALIERHGLADLTTEQVPGDGA